VACPLKGLVGLGDKKLYCYKCNHVMGIMLAH